MGLRTVGRLRASAALGAALTAIAAGARESARERVASDRKKLRDREELQLAAEEIFLARFHIELAHEALDEEQVDRTTHREDAVGTGVGHDLHGRVLASSCGTWGPGLWRRSVGGGSCTGGTGTLNASGFLAFLLGAQECGNRLGDFRDIGVLHFDETGGLHRTWLVDFLFEIDQLADERGVFGDDHGRGVGHGGDRAKGAELADDLSERVHRFGGLDVTQGHHIRDDRIAVGQRIIFVVDIDAAAGRAESAGGEGEHIEIRILGIGHEDEIFDRRSLAQKLGSLVESERVFRAGFLDEGKFRISSGLGNNHAAAGVFAVEAGEGVAAELGFDNVFDDRVFAERNAGFRVGRAGGLRRVGGRLIGIGGRIEIGADQALATLHGKRWRRLRVLAGLGNGRHGFLREQAGARGKDQGDDADEGHGRGTVGEKGFLAATAKRAGWALAGNLTCGGVDVWATGSGRRDHARAGLPLDGLVRVRGLTLDRLRRLGWGRRRNGRRGGDGQKFFIEAHRALHRAGGHFDRGFQRLAGFAVDLDD